MKNAIAREKQIKRWSRAKKIALIEQMNPKWDDLSRIWRGLPTSASDHVERAKPRSLDSVRRGGLRSG